jgi:hypothetical protein
MKIVDRLGAGSRGLALAVVVGLLGCNSTGVGPQSVAGMQPVGTVDMHEVQAAYLGSGSTGNGTLFFNGQSYPFSVAGVGVGGMGLSTVDARGEVYGLKTLDEFPGTYAEARYGFALGTTSSGDLWLENQQHVILHLKAKREGLMLSLGGSAVAISMTQ